MGEQLEVLAYLSTARPLAVRAPLRYMRYIYARDNCPHGFSTVLETACSLGTVTVIGTLRMASEAKYGSCRGGRLRVAQGLWAASDFDLKPRRTRNCFPVPCGHSILSLEKNELVLPGPWQNNLNAVTYRLSGTLDRLRKLDMVQHCKWIGCGSAYGTDGLGGKGCTRMRRT